MRLACTVASEHACSFWDAPAGRWSGEGCAKVAVLAAGGGGGGGTLVCNCSHLTDFSAQLDQTLDLTLSVVTSVEAFGGRDILRSLVVLVALAAVWGAAVAACAVAR